MSNLKKIAMVMPVFRNEGSLPLLVAELERLFEKFQPLYTHQYLFVNDGSDDGSMKVLLEMRQRMPHIEILELSRNFGQVPAIVAGLNEVDADAVLVMSADMQDPIAMVEKMIEAWEAGNDIVIAHRQDRGDSYFERMNAGIFQYLMRFSELNIPEGGFDFVLLDRKVNEALKQMDGRNRFLQGDILWLGFETKLIPYQRKSRPIGRSQWRKSKKLKYLVDGVLSASYWPIRLMTVIGFSIAAFSVFYVLDIVYMRIMHQTPFKGWAPIMVLILFMGGLIMMMLGVIGEYIWRIYDEVRGRPYYVVKKKYGRN